MTTDATRKPHVLSAKVDRWGELNFDLRCPYTLADRSVRSCLMGLEPTEPCEWDWYDKGEHHKDCPAFKDRNAKCVDVGAGFECWPAEPEECDGFSSEIGHVHPTEGCWAQELIGEIGWGEAVRWTKDEIPRDLALPAEVDVWCDDDGVTMALWTADVSVAPVDGELASVGAVSEVDG